MPSSRRPPISSHDWRRAAGSKPVVGSSRKISSGSPAMPSARSSRRRWPPESVGGARVLAPGQPDELEHLGGRPRVRVGGAVELDRLAHGDRRVEAGLLQHDPDPRAERALAAGGVVRRARRRCRRRRGGGPRGSRPASSCRRRWARAARAPRRGPRSGPRRRARVLAVGLAQAAHPDGVVGVQCHAISIGVAAPSVIGARVEPAISTRGWRRIPPARR